MPDRRRRNCHCCGKHESEVGAISWQGNCITCAVALEEENNWGVALEAGPGAWRRLRAMEKHVAELRARLEAKAV